MADVEPSFQVTQRQLAAHLRDPENNPGPTGIEDRRLAIYRDLIYNNIEGFISGGFPILRQLYSDEAWHRLVRHFVIEHEAHTPYFLEVSQEFLQYLQESQRGLAEKPFLLELAHYEWVELALDVSTEVYPTHYETEGDVLSMRPVVSPLAWSLSYQFPVHHIGPDYQPHEAPEQPTFLVVYRNRDDYVKFMESNAATHRLLALLQDDSQLTGRQALLLLADEMQAPDPNAIIDFGRDLLNKLLNLNILCGCR